MFGGDFLPTETTLTEPLHFHINDGVNWNSSVSQDKGDTELSVPRVLIFKKSQFATNQLSLNSITAHAMDSHKDFTK